MNKDSKLAIIIGAIVNSAIFNKLANLGERAMFVKTGAMFRSGEGR